MWHTKRVHAARPRVNDDSIALFVAAQVILALQQCISKGCHVTTARPICNVLLAAYVVSKQTMRSVVHINHYRMWVGAAGGGRVRIWTQIRIPCTGREYVW
jgi:hypothetical protein